MKTDEQKNAEFESMPPAVIEAMDLIFQLAKQFEDGTVTVRSLADAMKLAVSSGWDLLEIQFAMTAAAARLARKELGC